MIVERLARLFRRDQPHDITTFKSVFDGFRQLLAANNRALEIISHLEDKTSGEYIFDINYLRTSIDQLSDEINRIISGLNLISGNTYTDLFPRSISIQEELKDIVEGRTAVSNDFLVMEYEKINADLSPAVGEKNAVLGEIRANLKLPTPGGFVVTTAGYSRFMEHNNLWPQIKSIYDEHRCLQKGTATLFDSKIEELFAAASMPPDLETAIEKALNAVVKKSNGEHGFAVRSSAYGEDEEGKSYAGQFDSVLNCPFNEIMSAYAKVISSRFKHRVLVYDEKTALNETALPVAVGIQRMIPSRAAGVVYTIDVSGDFIDSMIMAASYGIGASVVAGSVNADYYRISRLDPTTILDMRIGKKDRRLVPAIDGGMKHVAVDDEFQSQKCLSASDILELSEKALLLERYFKRALDIEWCFDEKGVLFILQCRPLMIPRRITIDTSDLRGLLAEKPIIMRDKGQVAQRGIAAGKVWQLGEEDDPASFPVGAIAVTEQTSPRLASIIRRASAIVTDIGSSAGHMATVAREHGVPMIVNTSDATRLLRNGEEITVDAQENIIYKGIVKELLEYEVEGEDVFRDLEEYKILKRSLKKIAPLSLLDPKDSNFTAKNCRTYHDIIRFCHEKAVEELIDLNLSSRRFRGIKSKKIKLPIPLGLYVIDLGGGLTEDLSGDQVESVDQIQSEPMKAVLRGLTSPGTWNTQPMQFGLDDLVSSVTRYSLMDGVNEYQGQNLAVISDCYANINLRLGYHFNVLDTYVSKNINDNYIYFRFVGGVTESERRQLRAILLKRILENSDFKVTVSGDLVVARLKCYEAPKILSVLEILGKLIGFSRQLDTQMRSEEAVETYLNAFAKLQR